MTIPNLYLAIKKASPFHWYDCYEQRNLHKIQKLYYSTVPLPGIYSITTNKGHYLVAIRPITGEKDTENIFEPARKSYHDPNIRSKVDKANQTISNNILRNISYSSTRTTLNGDIDDKTDYFFGYYFTHPEHFKILEQDKSTHSKQYILFGTGGHAPHQKSPFRNHLIRKHHRFSPLVDFLGCGGESKLQEVDMNGFKKLRIPLRIVFCSITQRRMFASEVKIRTEEVLMCADITCMKRSHEACGRAVWRKMFALDDGYSWVEVGRLGRRNGNGLFRVDDETACMRKQSKEEMRDGQRRLERERGRFLEDNKEADYMSLLRYLQKEKWDMKEDGEHMERRTAGFAKLEFREWEERRETELAQTTALQKEELRMKLVKLWSADVQEAKAAEMGVEKFSSLMQELERGGYKR
jgi:hypothetical protein